jgi:hypothetical protein
MQSSRPVIYKISGHFKGNQRRYHVLLLDGDILRGKRTCRLDSAALALFHKTIQKQLSLSYTHEEYLRSCQTILRFNPGALARFGSRYRHMPERDV